MYRRIEDFLAEYGERAKATQSVLDALTDASLSRPVAEGHRALGAIAWHVAQSIPEMLKATGLAPDGPAEDAPVPHRASEIAEAYRRASRSALEQVRARWTDATLDAEDMMYGSKWKRGFTLTALVTHEIHHGGQMSVLMRQAGLRPPGVYGPAKEDWAKMGMAPPAI